MTCCRRWQAGGFIRMWCRLAATIYPRWLLLTSFSRYRLMYPGMCSAGRQSQRCVFRLMYGLKRMTKPGRYAWMPWLACRCFHLSR
ncbi:hypothetical protein MTE1_5306 [Klebsiella pneumoniae JHCK1]|nr:hypothetical protein MTE1_5306 [Klebsiella pneumoniae JHCK1]